MSAPDPREAAADWLSRRDAGVSELDEALYQEWLAADPRHARAAAEARAAWSLILGPRRRGTGELAVAAVEARRIERRRRRGIAAASIAAIAAAAAFLVLPALLPLSRDAERSMAASRPERRSLPDGSVVELNTGAEIALDFTASVRGVRLLRGEAQFAVVKNPARPFVVSAEGVSVRALGTQFAVRHVPSGIDVLVTEGRVRVSREAQAAGPEPEAVEVPAGARVLVASRMPVPPRPDPLSEAEVASVLGWRGMRVEFSGTALSEAVERFNRSNQTQILLGDRSLAGVRITGVFWVDDPDGFIRLLEGSVGVRTVRMPGERRILLPAP